VATPTHSATACDVAHERPDDRVVAIIVTFHPDPVALRRLVDSLLPQVDGLVVADNGSDGVANACLLELPPGFARCLDMGGNRGVADALNQGIEAAFASGASHVMLFDQDSLPAEDMTTQLLSAYRQLESQGCRVATVGPQYVDPRSGYVSPFVATKGLWLRRVEAPTPSTPVEADFLITSGSLISRESWAAIGPMAGPMFIDYVDIEWGLRARWKGFASYGVPAVRLSHSLGDRRMNFLGLSVPLHSPLRHYYQIRNPLWLYRQPWIALNWKLVDGFRLLLRFAFHAVFVPSRMANIRYMLRGLLDGLAGRQGRLE
jgi:rhamnosyltransferase